MDLVRVRMPPDLIHRMERYAKERALSRSDVIRLAVLEFLNKSENEANHEAH